MDKITIDECYNLMGIKKILYVEDDIRCEMTLDACIYDMLRILSKEEEDKILEEMHSISSELTDIARAILEQLRTIEIEWESIPKGNIQYLLEKKQFQDLLGMYNGIKQEDIELCEEIFGKYALGIQKDTIYIPETAVAFDGNNFRIPLRIFKDFTAESQKMIQEELEESIRLRENYVCIIDDQLAGENDCSKRIIDFICDKVEKANEYGTYLLLSSKNKKQYARFDKKIHIDYIRKEKGKEQEVADKICSALVKSNYSMLINKIKNKKLKAIEDAYNYALENKNIAIYLADMAQQEGVTNFEVIEEWIELRERFYWNHEEGLKKEIQGIVALSSLLSGVTKEDEVINMELNDSQKIRTFEEYDYDVNAYYKPINVGDIFAFGTDSERKYYLLVGQECDMSLRKYKCRYRRKTQECILLPIEILEESYVPKYGQSNGYEKVILGNFELENGSIASIRIDCTHEIVVDDIILDLCSYQSNGFSRIIIGEQLGTDKKHLVTYAMKERHKDISSILARCKEIKRKDGFEDIKQGIYLDEDKHISVYDFAVEDNLIYYGVQRICRLKRYVPLITKMYSEHKWRIGFDTINLDNVETINLTVQINDKYTKSIDAGVQLTNNRKKNGNRVQVKWYIKCEDLQSIFLENDINSEALSKLKTNDKFFIFDKQGDDIDGMIQYKKMCDGEFCHKLNIFVL